MKCEHDPCVQTRRHDGRWSGCVKDPGVYLKVMGLVLRRRPWDVRIVCRRCGVWRRVTPEFAEEVRELR
jgi:hypothetical protein